MRWYQGCLLTGFLVIAGLSLAGCQPPKPQPVKPDAKAKPAVEAVVPGEKEGATAENGTKAAIAAGEPAAEPAEVTAEPAAEAAAVTSKPADDDAAKSDKVILGATELFAGVPGDGPLKLADLQVWLDDPKNLEVLDFDLPLGLAAGRSQVVGVDKNPLTRAKIELGRQLYFDPRLSADGTISCASCHDPDEGYARRTQFGVGIQGQTGGRNSPVSYNRILSSAQFWDGRASSLEDQAIGPIANAIEMGNTHEAAVEALGKIEGYKLQFDKIFGALDIQTVGAALASFERAIVTGPSPYDYNEQFRPISKLDPEDLKDDDPALYAKYLAAEQATKDHPMSESALRGRELFFSDKANCTACHVGANFTDEKYHNLGVGMDKPEGEIDRGRAAFSLDEKEVGAFKTPTIRNVEFSGPYMHDGSQQTLEEVVEWYAKGGHPNPHLDEKVKKLDLTDQDKKDLVEFMKSTSGSFPKIERGRLPE